MTSSDERLMRAAFDETERLRSALIDLFYKMGDAEFADEATHKGRYVHARYIISGAADSLLAAIELLRPRS
jgi:hypothetical protein